MLDTIPANELKIFQSWPVKQAVVTKSASSSKGVSMPGIHVKDAPRESISVSPVKKLARMNTSKIHKFTPSVTFEQAINWLREYGPCDSSILFENGCCVLFEGGKYIEFEDIRDEDTGDEEFKSNDSGKTSQSADDDDDDDDVDHTPSPAPKPTQGIIFKIGDRERDEYD